jgi:hypothetical protein
VTAAAPIYWLSRTPYYSPSLGALGDIFQPMNSSKTRFPDLMDNLANSLSLSMRTIPYQPSPVVGKAFYPVTHAVVTWEWLILPVFELLTSLVLLLVIRQSSQSSLAPWTNDILASLFHGLDKRPPGQHTCKTQRDMEDEARNLLVEF